MDNGSNVTSGLKTFAMLLGSDSICAALGWAQDLFQFIQNRGSPSLALPSLGFPLYSLTCRSPFCRSSHQKDRVLLEFKLPVLLPHNFVWSVLPLGKVEREKRERKVTGIPLSPPPPPPIYTLFRPFSWFFWIEIQNVSQSFSSVLCHCGVLQRGSPWG